MADEKELLGLDNVTLDNKIRKHIYALTDGELRNLLRDRSTYTPAALRYAQEELDRRSKATTQHLSVTVPRRADKTGSAASSGKSSNLCYVEVWRDKNFEGAYLRIEGPTNCSDLWSEGERWGDSISSLQVGPCAFLQAFTDERFEGRMICFGPNEEVPDLSAFGADDRIGSIRIVNSLKIFTRLESSDVAEPPHGTHVEHSLFGSDSEDVVGDGKAKSRPR